MVGCVAVMYTREGSIYFRFFLVRDADSDMVVTVL